ncbi:Bug family tripartite tricarboxylate transporter substrate binding protein [Bordetella genomosp. 13]|nr:tripartite tricarboxylate transporter substrate binding protein [Bordetella genomosp. 13]
MTSLSRRHFLAASGAMLAAPMLARAETYPSRPVSIVVAFAPGGSLDMIARRIATHMAAELGVPFVVENRSGAGGRIGTQHVAKARGDGYTLIATSSAAHGVAPSLYPQAELGYRAMEDFSHIGLICKGPMALMVRADAPFDNAAELVAYSKSTGKPLFYGSGGIGSLGHLTGNLIGNTLGIPVEHVSYRGSAPAQADLLAGNLTAVCDNMSSHTAQFSAGAIKIIGLTAGERFSKMPTAATFAEQGYPQLQAAAWYGLSGSGGMPPAVVQKLNASLKRFLVQPDTIELLAGLSMVADDGMPADTYSRFVESELAKWGKVIRDSDIKVS